MSSCVLKSLFLGFRGTWLSSLPCSNAFSRTRKDRNLTSQKVKGGDGSHSNPSSEEFTFWEDTLHIHGDELQLEVPGCQGQEHGTGR